MNWRSLENTILYVASTYIWHTQQLPQRFQFQNFKIILITYIIHHILLLALATSARHDDRHFFTQKHEIRFVCDESEHDEISIEAVQHMSPVFAIMNGIAVLWFTTPLSNLARSSRIKSICICIGIFAVCQHELLILVPVVSYIRWLTQRLMFRDIPTKTYRTTLQIHSLNILNVQ